MGLTSHRMYVIKHLFHVHLCYITFITQIKGRHNLIVKLHRATRLRLVALYKSLTMSFLCVINVI